MRGINLKAIRIDGGTQSRVALSEPAVADYALVLAEGGELPPIVVFNDGADIWLADGFHRWHAYNREKRVSIPADVREGTRRDALLFALGANQAHGLRRTNEDKRKAVLALLEDVEWGKWSDRAIARHVGVSDKTVGAQREAICGNSADRPATRRAERGGTTYEQDTSGQKEAGKKRRAASQSVDTATATETASSVTEAQRQPGPVTTAQLTGLGHDDEDDLRAGEKALQEAVDLFTRAAESDDLVGELTREVKRLTALNVGLQSRIDGLMNEKNAAISKVRSLERELAKLKKAVPA